MLDEELACHSHNLSPSQPFYRCSKTVVTDEDLVEAGRFFTSAFWTGKVGGGAEVLTPSQFKELSSRQVNEFRRRYGGRSGLDKKSQLILCKNGKNELMGCLGVEVAAIERKGFESVRAPLMSNVAVGNKFRRKGVGKELVSAAEDIVRKQWGYNECYLYVEKRNVPAVRFYNNLGYRTAWETDEYQTLVPKESGRIISEPTLLLCMKRKLGGGFLSNLFL